MFESRIECIAFHGWGLDASFWDLVKNELSEAIEVKAADRGYFSEPVIPEFSGNPATSKMLLVHSFGLHWCPENLIEEADIVVLTGSFLSFLSDEERERKAEIKALDRMITLFKKEPDSVLQNFYTRAFLPHKSYSFETSPVMNHTLLLDDLKQMMNDHFDIPESLSSKSIFIIHGADDKIVSIEKARKMKEALPAVSSYFEIPGAGHLFPIPKSKIYAKKIEQAVKNYVNQT